MIWIIFDTVNFTKDIKELLCIQYYFHRIILIEIKSMLN